MIEPVRDTGLELGTAERHLRRLELELRRELEEELELRLRVAAVELELVVAGETFSRDFGLWRRQEQTILRRIARLAGAILQEPGDPAMAPALVGLRRSLVEWRRWREHGLQRGWQP